MHYDCIVVGLGGMGSAALYHLARRGQRTLGVEQFDIAHEMGSSHGLTRIIRLAYYEHPSYVPLLRRAYALWRDLERQSGQRLLHITGSVDASRQGEPIFDGSRRSCELHGIPHEVLTSAELSARFPGYRLPTDVMAVLQLDGGFLEPEKCIRAHMDLATADRADVHTGEVVRGWDPFGEGVRVVTDRATYTADRLVLAAGAWTARIAPELGLLAVPERQVMGWFAPRQDDLFARARFPVFNLLTDEGHYYGFPVFGVPGFKVGRYHHRGEIVDPDGVDRETHPADVQLLRACVERYFPAAAGELLASSVCMFTNSPDEHFIIDRHPDHASVIVAAGFSGHGFKFSSVVGEVLADLVSGGTAHDIAMFAMARFTGLR